FYFLVRRLLLDPVRTGSARRHGSLGRMGNVHIVRRPEGPAHGDLCRDRGRVDAEVVGDPGGGSVVDRNRAHTRTVRIHLAATRERWDRYADAHAARADCGCLRVIVRVRDAWMRRGAASLASPPARIDMARAAGVFARAARTPRGDTRRGIR